MNGGECNQGKRRPVLDSRRGATFPPQTLVGRSIYLKTERRVFEPLAILIRGETGNRKGRAVR